MLLQKTLTLLEPWIGASERFFYANERSKTGYYGGGYNAWSVQTNQKYLSALAVYAAKAEGARPELRELARERALQAFRYSMRSHLAGGGRCVDGTSWGHTWISVLGIERMMNGVFFLYPYLSTDEKQLLQKVLSSEADWLATEYHRGAHYGVSADIWGSSGKNDPESNIWNGAFLWRVAQMYPNEPQVSVWKERALEFLATGITTEKDVDSTEIWDGKPLKERCKGPNFFPNYALDHHGYFNLGYMVICLSNVAIAWYDSKLWGYETPQLLHLHSADLWQVVKKMVLQDGRLARIGGDSRVRYAYCQEYLMQTLVYAADYLQDPDAQQLLERQLQTVDLEQATNKDGSYYATRLQWLKHHDPVYYTRLESDRANCLGAVAAYWSLIQAPQQAGSFEQSVAGGWSEPDHGEILHRSANRLAAFSWNAFHPGQGTMLPPDDGHLMEWDHHLSGEVRFSGELYQKRNRRSDRWWMESFNGGFVTQGNFIEGLEVALGEGWTHKDMGNHQLAWLALPDDHTILVMEYATVGALRTWVQSAMGMHFNLPNDLFNRYQRTLQSSDHTWVLDAENRSEELLSIADNRLIVEQRTGITGIYGGEGFVVSHPTQRTGGPFHSLYCDVIGYSGCRDPFVVEPHGVTLDCGWSVQTSAEPLDAGKFFSGPQPIRLDWEASACRVVEITGQDGLRYRMFANFSSEPVSVPEQLTQGGHLLAGCLNNGALAAGQSLVLVIR